MAESRDSLVKSTLIQRIEKLVTERRSTITDFSQRQQLRDELVEFGEQFLDQEAFNRLIGIMRRGGVDLLTIPPLSKEKQRPLKRKREESDAIPDELLIRKIESLKREMDQVKGRISALEPHEAQPPNNSDLICLPFQTKEQVDEANERLKVDREYYEALVARIRQLCDETLAKTGYYGVLNEIFERDVMYYYHYVSNMYVNSNAFGVLRKPMHSMPIFNDVLVDAFGGALDKKGVKNEVLNWFRKTRGALRKRKSYEKVGRGKKSQNGNSGEEALVEVKILEPF